MTVDWTKPIELVDGTPARFSYIDSEGDIAVNIDGIEDGLARIYTTAGKHYYGKLPDIRNVADTKSAPINFQIPKNRWAAEMACAEVNAAIGHTYWSVPEVKMGNPTIYCFALRILRTETRPVDHLLLKAREIVAKRLRSKEADGLAGLIEMGLNDDHDLVIVALAALKERG